MTVTRRFGSGSHPACPLGVTRIPPCQSSAVAPDSPRGRHRSPSRRSRTSVGPFRSRSHPRSSNGGPRSGTRIDRSRSLEPPIRVTEVTLTPPQQREDRKGHGQQGRGPHLTSTLVTPRVGPLTLLIRHPLRPTTIAAIVHRPGLAGLAQFYPRTKPHSATTGPADREGQASVRPSSAHRLYPVVLSCGTCWLSSAGESACAGLL